MFTGIITDVGEILSLKKTGDTRIAVATSYDTSTIDFGASIACSGVCLTVVDKGDNWFSVDVSGETLSCTTLGSWQMGTKVNLERSLKVGEELGGHIVSGHVDAVGDVISVEADGDSKKFTFSLPENLKSFVVQKGSITINGASLTVNKVTDQSGSPTLFTVNIIPHTFDKTTFGNLKDGDRVNLEIDILARYVSRMREA